MSYIGNTPAENYASFLTETFSVSATANYTLTHAVSNENDIRLVINSVVQQPGSGKAYTASGTTLTLTSATSSGDVMYAVYLGRALQTVTPPNASVGTSQLIDGNVTLAKLASGTDGNIISYDTSGNPVAVATGNDGQVLTSAGAGAVPTFETLPVGGITVANLWRLTASKTDNSIISANLEIADDASSGNIGSAMTQSSGVFTFPSTGIYLINWQVKFAFNNVSDGQASVFMEATMDNSSYDVVTYTVAGSHATGGSSNFSVYGQAIVDVTNTSNVKVRFTAESMNSGTSIFGDSTVNNTSFAFIRLGAT